MCETTVQVLTGASVPVSSKCGQKGRLSDDNLNSNSTPEKSPELITSFQPLRLTKQAKLGKDLVAIGVSI